jgi:hypothetical protein
MRAWKKMITAAAVALTCLGGAVAHATTLVPEFGADSEALELPCDSRVSSVVVLLAASRHPSVTKTVRCQELGTYINKPFVDVLKKMRHGREGKSRLPFTAAIDGTRWHFVATYEYFRGREIPQSNFDDYVNICLDKSLHLYARGGKLYCYVQPAGFYGVSRP